MVAGTGREEPSPKVLPVHSSADAGIGTFLSDAAGGILIGREVQGSSGQVYLRPGLPKAKSSLG